MQKLLHKFVAVLAALLLLCSCSSVPGSTGSSSVEPSLPSISPSAELYSSEPQPATPSAGVSVTLPDTDTSPSAALPSDSPEPSVSSSPKPSVFPSQSPQPTPETPQTEIVTVKIEGPDGWITEGTEVEHTDGMTAADAIIAACEAESIDIETKGSGKTTYLVSIGGFSEKSEGALSGWIFKLNGVHSAVGAGSAELTAGDRISVYFSLDMGADAKDKD